MLYTTNGQPLNVQSSHVFDRGDKHLAHIEDDKIYDVYGQHAATIVGDRAVYRSVDAATISSPSTLRVGTPTAQSPASGSGLWDEEPFSNLR